jgi:ankyrin repeat protein
MVAACQGNHAQAVVYLLNAGAKVTFQNEKEATPLLVAAEHRSCEVADLPLKHSAKLGASYRDGWNVVDIAVENNDRDLVRVLAQHFPKLTTTQLRDPLAVDRAIRDKDLEAASSLLNAGNICVLRSMRMTGSTEDDGEPIVGDEYLTFLCSKAVKLQRT